MKFAIPLGLVLFLITTTILYAFDGTLNARSAIYVNVVAVQGVGITSSPSARLNGATALINTYRNAFGLFSIQMPSRLQVVWRDGSREEFRYDCFEGDNDCITAVPGTGQPAPPPSNGDGGNGGSGPGNGGGSGYTPPGCVGRACPGPGSVVVGPPSQIP